MPPLKTFEQLVDDLIEADIDAAIERDRYEPEQLDFDIQES